MCHDCYDKEHPDRPRKAPLKRPASIVELQTVKRVRRTQSDPGELISLTRKRVRAQPPPTVPAPKKIPVMHPCCQSLRSFSIKTHAQRLALLAAEKSGTYRVGPPVRWDLIVCD